MKFKILLTINLLAFSLISSCTAGLAGALGGTYSVSSAIENAKKKEKFLHNIYLQDKRERWLKYEKDEKKQIFRLLIPYVNDVRTLFIYKRDSSVSNVLDIYDSNIDKLLERDDKLLAYFLLELGQFPKYSSETMLFHEVNKNPSETCSDVKCHFDLGAKKEFDYVLRISVAINYPYKDTCRRALFFAQMLDVKSKRVLKSGAAHCQADDEASLKAAIHSVIEQVRIDK